MVEEGFVVHLAEEHRYGLGVAAFEVGSGYARQGPLQRIARRPLAALVDATGHTAHLAVLHGRDVLYVVEERARRPTAAGDRRRRPAARPPDGERPGDPRARSRRPRCARCSPTAAPSWTGTASGRTSLSALRTLLSETRQRGYAVENGEVTPGFASVAAAVLDHNGHPVAGLAVTFPAAEVDVDRPPLRRRTTSRRGR